MDNFFVSGLESGVVQQSLGRMRCIVEGWGFSVHEVTEAQPVVHGVGLVIDGESRCVLDPGQDLEITIGCSCAVLGAGAPWRAKVVEKVVGHFKFAIMVQVHFLAGHATFGVLWRAAQQELLQASSSLPLRCTSFDLPWSPVVIATDSDVTPRTVDEALFSLVSKILVCQTNPKFRV